MTEKTTDEKISFLATYSNRSEETLRAIELPEDRLNTLFNKASRHEKLSRTVFMPAFVLTVAMLGAQLVVPKDTIWERASLMVFAVSCVVAMAGMHIFDKRDPVRREIDRAAREKLVATYKPS